MPRADGKSLPDEVETRGSSPHVPESVFAECRAAQARAHGSGTRIPREVSDAAERAKARKSVEHEQKMRPVRLADRRRELVEATFAVRRRQLADVEADRPVNPKHAEDLRAINVQIADVDRQLAEIQRPRAG